MSRDKVAYGRGLKTGSFAVMDMKIEAIHKGVSATWMSQAFNMSPVTVKKKLKNCPSIGSTKAGFLYDLSTAASYLVKPSISVEEYFKNMKPEDMPSKLQDKYWSARMRRIKYEEKAGVLWHTDKVLEVLGDVFQTMKFSLQLWVDTLERATGLTEEQRALLRELVDSLQDDIYKKLKDMESAGSTPSVLGDVSYTEEDLEEEEEDLIG